ncbi:MAG: phosphotransferase [Acidobacteriaceae bacterium]|nr:phosphotransferase [Acidobacteriaceae bacterium]
MKLAIQSSTDLYDAQRPPRAWAVAGGFGESTRADSLLPHIRDLVHSNKAQIFPSANTVEIFDLALGPPQYRRQDRYHRSLVVNYRSQGSTDFIKIWLKFRPGLYHIYPLLAACQSRLDPKVFPTPYFAGSGPNEDESFLATAHVDGTSLRNRLLRLAALRRTGELECVFRSNGAKMRQFHDVFASPEVIAVASVVDRVMRLLRESRYFTGAEKNIVLACLDRCRSLLGEKTLPAVLTHNDWLLRNILVTPCGTDYVVDCDSMRYPPNWRWVDVAYLLLNVESQRKWYPLINRRMMEELWRAFWSGYIGEKGLPDGLTGKGLAAVLYIVRVQWLVGAAVRPPYFEIMAGPSSQRLLISLKRSVLLGHYSLFGFLE